jgi:hypothetical protein
VIALAAIFIAAVFLPLLADWTQSGRTLELSGLVLAAILTSMLRVQQSTTKDRAIMPPSFVINFSALLLFGPNVAMLVATAGAPTPGFLGSRRAYALRPLLVEATFAIVATQIGVWHTGRLVVCLAT